MPIINVFDAQNPLIFATQMALSVINHDINSEINDFPSVADSCHNPNSTPFGFKLWVQTAKNPKRSASFNKKSDNNNDVILQS